MTKQFFPPPNWPPAPPGWTPPPGWQPDPKWGPPPANWLLWREDSSWFSRHKVLTGVGGGVALLLMLSAVGNAGNSTDQASTAATTAPASSSSAAVAPPGSSSSSPLATPQPSSPSAPTGSTPEPQASEAPSDAVSDYGNYPSAERDFVKIVEKARADAGDADNDLQYGAALSHRNRSLCKVVGSGKVKKWVGKVSKLDSNGDGFGVLAIDIADGTAVGTWNNALSDFEDNTLIKPGDLLDKLSTLEEDQPVEFSGRLIKQSGTCVNDKRLTKVGKLNDPEFVFKFSSVEGLS